jgi:hypothetical protein
MRTYIAGLMVFAYRGLVWGLIGGLGGCVTNYPSPFYAPPPYNLLPVDETMSCDGIAASFRFAARRAARLEYWLSVGRPSGYGYGAFPVDAPGELIDERRRLDALSDLQRFKGCYVLDPGAAVFYERSRLEGPLKQPRAPVVLNSKG